jgi:hypothetical protein
MNVTIYHTILSSLLIVGIIIGLFVWIHFSLKNKCQRNYSLSPILFSLNAFIYSILAHFGFLSKEAYVIWGDLVSIHGIIILISTGLVLIKYTGGKK